VSTENLDRNTKFIVRHLKFGWWSLLVFLVLGIVLEGLHAFKVGAYLNSDVETRRLMWRLAHAHGTLVALVHLGFAATLKLLPTELPSMQKFASPLLMATTILLPGGFFLGGCWIYGGDPGHGIFLVPFGAGCFLIAVLLCGLGALKAGKSS